MAQGQQGDAITVEELPQLKAADARRCRGVVYIDGEGRRVADPWALLGVEEGAAEDAVREAWAEQMRQRPPERFPEEARAAREARERLVEASNVYLRALGALRLPDADAWGLPQVEASAKGAEAREAQETARLSAGARLWGQAALYVLVEGEVMGGGEEVP